MFSVMFEIVHARSCETSGYLYIAVNYKNGDSGGCRDPKCEVKQASIALVRHVN